MYAWHIRLHCVEDEVICVDVTPVSVLSSSELRGGYQLLICWSGALLPYYWGRWDQVVSRCSDAMINMFAIHHKISGWEDNLLIGIDPGSSEWSDFHSTLDNLHATRHDGGEQTDRQTAGRVICSIVIITEISDLRQRQRLCTIRQRDNPIRRQWKGRRQEEDLHII